ncbi:helix-turn-helix domain-containing protein [Parablautia intestinalis]|uniref:helix-turn-helix domain-containing protein n=1 Tax=Parablautia intestinalis TaxID=2320100 RepID=UPI00256EA021|nr:helix-turn-helix domain-containing protein [Parablautia intestinalis]
MRNKIHHGNAAKLLSTTQSSVSAIARDTGFENIGYFCRRFKKTFGVTPGEYRMKTSL